MPRDHDSLPEAVRPFSRALEAIDQEAQGYNGEMRRSIERSSLAGALVAEVEPTVADLRRLVEWAEGLRQVHEL